MSFENIHKCSEKNDGASESNFNINIFVKQPKFQKTRNLQVKYNTGSDKRLNLASLNVPKMPETRIEKKQMN